jgi:hypothetical protein
MSKKAKCPCAKACRDRRVFAVNLVLEKEILTASDLRTLLLGSGQGKYVTRKSLEFLGSGNCTKVEVLVSLKDHKPLRFGRRGKLFYRRTIDAEVLRKKIVELLAPLQKRILDKFTKMNRRIFYFSTYDLRRIHSSSGYCR